jgi:hypothetical protein
MSETRTGYREAVAAVFQAKPNVWLPARKFYKAGGQNGWRTRISQCRVELKMQIDNKGTIRVRRADGTLKYILSLYRYVPAVSETEQTGHDVNAWSLR